ncbi:MAG TPA: hypothetical protein VFG11_10415 [Acidobacteriota bacterium]|nr:hypothetical protein [Acidobacteriota bacterium]
MKKHLLWLSLVALVVLTLTLADRFGVPSIQASSPQTLTLDVACDSTTYRVNQATPGVSGLMRGDTFVLDGKIYQGGSIPTGGTRESPSPFGPQQAGSIGNWYCRGVYIVDKSQYSSEKLHTETTQIFLLSDKTRYITEGFEGPTSVMRSVIGGFNANPGIAGQVQQDYLGVNSTGGYNLRFTFTLSQ